MNKKFWGTIAAIGALLSLGAMFWGVSSYWYSYTAAETIHEHEQTAEIKLAMDKSQLAIDQQRVAWLEERIWEMENKYGCKESGISHSCSSRIWRTYQKYLKEYEFLIGKISEQTGDN